LVDAYQDDIAGAYKTIRDELKAYKVDLSGRKQLVALSKVDGLDEEITKDRLEELKKVVPKSTTLLAISALSGQGTKELLRAVKDAVAKERAKIARVAKKEAPGIPVLKLKTDDAWKVEKSGDRFIITGRKIERFAQRTDFGNSHAVRRLRDIMKKMGIMHELRRKGVEAGDKIAISGETLDY
jgi:GTP-binding protein